MSEQENKKLDWSVLVEQILTELYMTQKELASLCRVKQQTISFWKNSIHTPGIFARKVLLQLKAKIEKKDLMDQVACMKAVSKENMMQEDEIVRHINHISERLSHTRKKGLLQYAYYLYQYDEIFNGCDNPTIE